MEHIYGKYYVEKETAGRFQILQKTERGYASIGCYFFPSAGGGGDCRPKTRGTMGKRTN